MELLIVNYHYFREEKYQSGIYPVSEKEFIEQLEFLKDNYKVLSQAELIEIINSQQDYNQKFVLITFDDGLKEQMKAYQILRQMNLNAIFYVTTDSIERHTCVDVHKIHYIRSLLNDSELYKKLDERFKISSFNFDQKVLNTQYKYDELLSQKVKYYLNFVLQPEERGKFINHLFNLYVEDEFAFANKLYMSIDDIRELSLSGMLGTHCASHQPLSKMSEEMINIDIERSLNFFQKIGIDKIFSISYPYGGKTAVDNRVVKQAKKLGFDFGLTMFRGTNDYKYIKNNKMSLQRISCSDLLKEK